MKNFVLILFVSMLSSCMGESSYDNKMYAEATANLSGNEINSALFASSEEYEFDAKEAADGYDYTTTPSLSTPSKKLLAYADKTAESKSNQQQPKASKNVKKNQKIIRTANVNMEVKTYDKARVELDKIINEFNATVESEAEERSTYRIHNNFVIRVSPEKLDGLIDAITAIGIDIDSKSINSRNVTRQYVDLETRLASKRAVIERYRAILKTAKTIKDILNVEEHLRNVVEEVESMEGQLRLLKDKVGESTLNLYFYENFDSPAVKKRGFFSRIGKAMGNGWKGGQEMIIGFVTVWPFWIILGGLFWFVRRTWRKRKKKF